jgi:hypothetical protein
LVWHFYQVFFDPDVYPMSWTWWDGKMSCDDYREEHALDTETLLEATRARIAGEPADQPAQVALSEPGAEESESEPTEAVRHK